MSGKRSWNEDEPSEDGNETGQKCKKVSETNPTTTSVSNQMVDNYWNLEGLYGEENANGQNPNKCLEKHPKSKVLNQSEDQSKIQTEMEQSGISTVWDLKRDMTNSSADQSYISSPSPDESTVKADESPQEINGTRQQNVRTEERKVSISKKQKEITKFYHPMYILYDTDSEEDGDKIFQFMKKKKHIAKILIGPKKIKENFSTFTKDSLKWPLNEDEEKTLLRKLSDINTQMTPTAISEVPLLIKHSTCSILIIHKNNRSDLEMISGILEVFIIEKLCKVLSIEYKETPESQKTFTPLDKDESLCKTYEAQEIIGNEMYERIVKKIGEDNWGKFEDLKFVILVPNRLSLEKQTRDRLKSAVASNAGSLTSSDEGNVIRICANSDEMAKKWSNFLESVKKNPDVFHLVIHDECHHAASHNGESFKFLFQNGDYHNQEKNHIYPNVFTVMVSATPFNFFPSKHLQSNDILNWRDFFKDKGIKTEYQGLSELISSSKIKIANQMTDLPETHQHLFFSGLKKEVYGIIQAYVFALRNYRKSDTDLEDFTCESVRKCIMDKKLIVIRVPSSQDQVKGTAIIKGVLENVIRQLNLDIQVVSNTESAQENKSSIDQFNCNGVSTIMLIIEKCRLGDTFPPSCVTFDLRARYLSSVKDFTPIIQDVGRTFGYGDRPILVVSKEAFDFLEKVWDSEKGEINWKKLKTEYTIVLGKNMERKNLQKKPSNEIIGLQELELFLNIFESKSSDPNFLYDIERNGFQHRLVLRAEPQIGKTGTFLHLIQRISCALRKSNNNSLSELKRLTARHYYEKTLAETTNHFKTSDGKKEYKRYMENINWVRKLRLEKKILEPALWAAKMLIQDLLDLQRETTELLKVADFGCGDMQFAKMLSQEIGNHDEMKKFHFILDAYDLSSNIPTLAEKAENLDIKHSPEKNCGDEQCFVMVENHYDYVVSTCALWGSGDTWKSTIKNALKSLKVGGRFIVAEFLNQFCSRTLFQGLGQAKLGCVAICLEDLGDFEIETFNRKFGALVIEKKSGYNSEKLSEILRRGKP